MLQLPPLSGICSYPCGTRCVVVAPRLAAGGQLAGSWWAASFTARIHNSLLLQHIPFCIARLVSVLCRHPACSGAVFQLLLHALFTRTQVHTCCVLQHHCRVVSRLLLTWHGWLSQAAACCQTGQQRLSGGGWGAAGC
jgi:hypothetical protein